MILWNFFFGNTKPSNPTRMFQPPQRRRRNKAYSGESVFRPTSPHTSVFLVAIFSRNGRKIYTISSKNNPRVAPFQVDCDYCLDSKRNHRNSTGWRYLCTQWRKVEFPVAHGNVNFVPRTGMLNWLHSPFKLHVGKSMQSTTSESTKIFRPVIKLQCVNIPSTVIFFIFCCRI